MVRRPSASTESMDESSAPAPRCQCLWMGCAGNCELFTRFYARNLEPSGMSARYECIVLRAQLLMIDEKLYWSGLTPPLNAVALVGSIRATGSCRAPCWRAALVGVPACAASF